MMRFTIHRLGALIKRDRIVAVVDSVALDLGCGTLRVESIAGGEDTHSTEDGSMLNGATTHRPQQQFPVRLAVSDEVVTVSPGECVFFNLSTVVAASVPPLGRQHLPGQLGEGDASRLWLAIPRVGQRVSCSVAPFATEGTRPQTVEFEASGGSLLSILLQSTEEYRACSLSAENVLNEDGGPLEVHEWMDLHLWRNWWNARTDMLSRRGFHHE